jgi:hypothetical protein
MNIHRLGATAEGALLPYHNLDTLNALRDQTQEWLQ